MRAILVRAGQDVQEVDIEHTLEAFYDCLECDIIDITRRKIGGGRYAIVVDDMGLMKADPIVSAYDEHLRPMLVGNLLIANEIMTPEGADLASLTDLDVQNIAKNVLTVTSYRGVYKAVQIG